MKFFTGCYTVYRVFPSCHPEDKSGKGAVVESQSFKTNHHKVNHSETTRHRQRALEKSQLNFKQNISFLKLFILQTVPMKKVLQDHNINKTEKLKHPLYSVKNTQFIFSVRLDG